MTGSAADALPRREPQPGTGDSNVASAGESAADIDVFVPDPPDPDDYRHPSGRPLTYDELTQGY